MKPVQWNIGTKDPEFVFVVGQLALAGWRVEHDLAELGRALGNRVEREHHTNAARLIEELLTVEGVPAWAAASVDEVMSWLGQATAWLQERDRYLGAAATRSGQPKFGWLDEESEEPIWVTFSVADYEELVERCGQLLLAADELQSRLILPRADGGGQAGFRDIARTLYLQALDPGTPKDRRPVAPS